MEKLKEYFEINPHIIPWWKAVKFNFIYKGSKISASITQDTYSINSCEDVKIIFKGREILVSAGENVKINL
ncbi:MAG: hypothetical protein K5768_07805 [Firmicutes bacterium]|nr:hypothetical protein [Bacillota bacterium]